MLFWVKTAALFLIRSKRTSVVLTLMVISAVSCLIFLSSLAMGVNDAMIRNSVGLFSGHISGYNIPSNISNKDLSVKGVANVLKRVQLPGFIHVKNKMEMITLIGIDPAQELKSSAFWKKTIKGRFIQEGTNELFISESLSKRLGAVCGDIISFSQQARLEHGFLKKEFVVVGIYKTGISQLDTGISFCDIGTLENKQSVWDAAIFLQDGVDIDMILQEYRNKNLDHNNFKTWKQLMPDLEQLISLNYFSMTIVIIVVFIIVSLGITSAFSIFILKSIREYGIMKVMGMTSKETVFLLCWEVFLLNIVASALGIIVGVLVVLIFQTIGIDLSAYTSHNQYFIVSGVVYPRLTIYSVWLPPLSALLFSLPAAIWPAIMVSRKNAAQILRGA
ncbi:MAG: ABC transporter permease [Desulfobacteraceae bacterium]|nr:ABC transporter permease [Desulfobacteraceae bacterium]